VGKKEKHPVILTGAFRHSQFHAIEGGEGRGNTTIKNNRNHIPGEARMVGTQNFQKALNTEGKGRGPKIKNSSTSIGEKKIAPRPNVSVHKHGEEGPAGKLLKNQQIDLNRKGKEGGGQRVMRASSSGGERIEFDKVSCQEAQGILT